MAENSKIEWCDHTVNFVIGCTKVSEGCLHCYAEALDRRYQWNGGTHWGENTPRYVRPKALADCLRLNRKAVGANRNDKVFINSLSDTFEGRDDLEEARAALWAAIAMCHHLTFLLLTKRPENVLKMVPEQWRAKLPDNIWVGTTAETQQRAGERIPELLKIPAKIHFLSVEPMLEEIDIQRAMPLPSPGEEIDLCNYIHWVICGGESGQKKRPFDCEWARSMRDQCQAAGVAYFFKQVDKVQRIPEDLGIREFPNTKGAR
jgi:protein gp37